MRIISLTLTISELFFCNPAFGQTATPSVPPPLPLQQPIVDRNGFDRTSGVIAHIPFETIEIGNETSGLKVSNNANSVVDVSANIIIERVTIYQGGFVVARVSARGKTHVFQLGRITLTYYPGFPPSGHAAWFYSPDGSSGSLATSDTYHDYTSSESLQSDGAILVCSGAAGQMHRGGVCSLYLAEDGTRTDLSMPDTAYDLAVRNYVATDVPSYVAYAWPSQMEKSDGEIIKFRYNNYTASNWPVTLTTPPPSQWNAIDSSLGFRVYLSNATPANTPNPGAFDSNFYRSPLRAKELYAINLSKEYADPQQTTRTFTSNSMSARWIQVQAGGDDVMQNGVKVANVSYISGSEPFGTVLSRPSGAQIIFRGLPVEPRFTGWGSNGSPSTPTYSYPALGPSITRNSTTSYSITVDNTAFFPEKYTGTVNNPDGSTERFEVRLGLLLSSTDGLSRKTMYDYTDMEGYFNGIQGYARRAKLAAVTSPSGSKVMYGYTHGALASVKWYPTDGGAPQVTTVELEVSCSVDNYRYCNKPKRVTDARGNVTEFEYYPQHGGIKTETLPANAAGVRPQRRHTYQQLYPRVLSASGQLINSTPIWRLVRTSECLSATLANPASCVGTANERVTTYAYNDPNLFMTSRSTAAGDGSLSSSTIYGYDYVGNTAYVDGPLPSDDDRVYFVYDKLRRKVFEIGADIDGTGPKKRSIVHHVFDMDGNEVRTESGTGSMLDGSDFIMRQFVRSTFDPVTGSVVKLEAVVP